MSLSQIDKSLLAAAYFRGNDDNRSNCDQVITLSLFYTRDISGKDCAQRFSVRRGVQGLYEDELDDDGNAILVASVALRYLALIDLIQREPDLIQGGGNLRVPAHPTFTSCHLTETGLRLAISLIPQFPAKPDFPNWPDKRSIPE